MGLRLESPFYIVMGHEEHFRAPMCWGANDDEKVMMQWQKKYILWQFSFYDLKWLSSKTIVRVSSCILLLHLLLKASGRKTHSEYSLDDVQSSKWENFFVKFQYFVGVWKLTRIRLSRLFHFCASLAVKIFNLFSSGPCCHLAVLHAYTASSM